MFSFDEYGHLAPDQPIEATLEELEGAFVFNDHRKLIFEKLLELLSELQKLEPGSFLVWLDGSFVPKKENSRDVDCVFFIGFEWMRKYELKIEAIQKKYFGLVDSYFVSIYPENHRFRVRTDSDRIKWLHFFTTNRKKLVKGLVQINFYEDGDK